MDAFPAGLLWHTGSTLGAALITRLGMPAPAGDPGVSNRQDPLPPPLVAHRLRAGDPRGLVDRYRAGSWRPGTAGDPELLLTLLEHDDPAINRVLFHHGGWPALQRAVLSGRRHTPGTATTTGERPTPAVPLHPELRAALLASDNPLLLEPALCAADPDIALWALLGGHRPRRPMDVARACLTLLNDRRTAQLRTVLRLTGRELPALPPALLAELTGHRPLHALPDAIGGIDDHEDVIGRLRAARHVDRARAAVRSVLIPDWRAVADAHAAEPLPRAAVLALVEHPRHPVESLLGHLRAHPDAIHVVKAPPAALLHDLIARGRPDQEVKAVLNHGLAAGTLSAGDVLAVRPARLAFTALDSGPPHAAPVQVEAGTAIRRLLRERFTSTGPAQWRGLHAALPTDGRSALELLATVGPRTDGAPPRPGRQAAWAYTVLIGLAGPSTVADATAFLADHDLAPLAGSPSLPGFLAHHLAAAGGPVCHRVLAGNPAVPLDVLEELAGATDPAVTAAAFRNTRATPAIRHTVLDRATPLDATLRRELLETRSPEWLRSLSGARDPELLIHRAWHAGSGPDARGIRLRAALRIAELAGTAALDRLPPDGETRAAAATADPTVLRNAVDALLRRRHEVLLGTPLSRQLSREKGAFAEALADPGPDWEPLIAHVRRGGFAHWAYVRLAEHPEAPAAFLPPGPDGTRVVPWWQTEKALTAGVLTIEHLLATASAKDVLATCPRHPPLARAVTRLLSDTLGTDVETWAVLAHLLTDAVDATLPELATTAAAVTA